MKRLSKLICSIGLTVAVLGGAVLSGCADTTNYTQEIKDYQAKIESLAAENEALKAQLAENGTQTAETEAETFMTETETAADETAATETETTETETAGTAPAESEQGTASNGGGDDIMRILVLGDSIWDNDRDSTGVGAKVEYYLSVEGCEAKVYNAAIGGTSATIKPEESEWNLSDGADCSLNKMISILEGKESVDALAGKAAYDVVCEVMPILDQIDLVIISYGMNDFLNQVPLNDSNRPWTGYGTALTKGVEGARRVCKSARVMIIGPSYGSYFPNGVQNMGDRGLFNYAKVARMVIDGGMVLGLDPYNDMGVDAYNADEYLEDGIHFNEYGRGEYAKQVASCILNGQIGQVSGNAMIFE